MSYISGFPLTDEISEAQVGGWISDFVRKLGESACATLEVLSSLFQPEGHMFSTYLGKISHLLIT